MSMRAPVTLCAIAFVYCVSLAVESAPAADEPWQRDRETLKKHPDVVRLYLFDQLTAESREVPSVAGEQQPLRLGGNELMVVCPGRVPGKTAVRLDGRYMTAKPFDVAKGSLSIEIWARQRGNAQLPGLTIGSGMFLAQGDGYWSGLRLMLDSQAQRLQFMVGRPKPLSAIGTSARQPVAEGTWNHLAAVWDADQLKLYWNGLPAGTREYAGDYTPPRGSLRIGYAGAGVGALKLDVDQLAVFKRALAAEEILAHALDGEPITNQAAGQMVRAASAMVDKDWATARKHYEAALAQADLGHRAQSMARLGLGQALMALGDRPAGVRQLAALLNNPTARPAIKQAAVGEFLADDTPAVRAAGSVEVYKRLLGSPGLSDQQQLVVRLCLAERHLRSGEAASARAEFDTVLRTPNLEPQIVWDVRLKRAHTFLAAKDYAAARQAYEELASSADAPTELCATSRLAIAHAFYRQKAYGEAATAFDRVAKRADVPGYLRGEARERAGEMRRLAQGLSARDPAAGRFQLAPDPQPAATLYVAPDGKADNPGTKEQPLGSLGQARDAARKLRRDGKPPVGGVAVIVRGGSYATHETFVLEPEDSGAPGSPIIYRAAEGERPVFSGGVQLTGFNVTNDAAVLQRLPEPARGRVVQLDLKRAGVENLGRMTRRGYGSNAWGHATWVDLYVGGRPMQLARWPNEGFVQMGEVLQGKYRGDDGHLPGRFVHEGDRPKRWRRADDLWLFGYWSHLWAGSYEKVADFDTETGQVTIAAGRGLRQGYPYYAINLIEELDRPGEWFLDRKSGIVYLWPPGDLAKTLVEMPLLEKPFVAMNDVEHVTIRGLTFDLARGDGILVQGGTGVRLVGCTIRRLGGSGVYLAGGTDNGVLGCDIGSVGARGVIVRGGELKSLTPGRHFVENCHIHDFTRVDRVYAPAIQLHGVGNRAAYNLMNDSPHHAIRLEGHEHTIEMNEIHSVVYESDDQAGLDVWGSPILRGNVVRYNFWHHIGSGREVAGQSGIRLDDMISTFIMYGNVFYRAAGGRFGAIQIHGGKDNVADNNLFIECKAAVSFSPWGGDRFKKLLADPRMRRRIFAGGVDITKPPFSTRYPDLTRMEENPNRNFLRRNLIVDCGQPRLRDWGVNQWQDNLQLCSDPGFVDQARGNFDLPPDSPVYDRFGFRPIPFGEIGLYESPTRASWPVQTKISREYVREY